MRKVGGGIPLERDEARSLSRSIYYSTSMHVATALRRRRWAKGMGRAALHRHAGALTNAPKTADISGSVAHRFTSARSCGRLAGDQVLLIG